MNGSRRDFLQAACAGLGVTLLDRNLPPNDLENIFKEIRKEIFQMINEERDVEKVQLLEMDDLASEVATKHAVDLVSREFIGHWGSDGLKPYHRYSAAGGTHATEENVSAADGIRSTSEKDLKQDSAYLHVRMYQEKPPNDGHRRTILAPQHTHVGIGFAVQALRLRMVQLYVAKYVDLKPIKREAKPGAQLSFSGKIIRSGYLFNNIEVFYEPLPTPPDLEWLRQPRSYALPKDSRTLKPRVPPPFTYTDGTTGIVEVYADKSFQTPVSLYKNKPGIYTIVVWLRTAQSRVAFPATAVCIKAL